jgi:hypothetical protein
MNKMEDKTKEEEDEIVEKEEPSEDICEEEDALVEELDRDIINDIKSIFKDSDCAYPLDDVIDELEELGYKNPGGVITLALQDEAIYVDSVEDSGMVYLAIVEKDEEE